jgi:hypothetical protein
MTEYGKQHLERLKRIDDSLGAIVYVLIFLVIAICFTGC